MVPDHFVDHEANELLAEFGIEIGFDRQRAQAFDLKRLAARIARRETGLGLVLAYRLGDAEAFGEHVDQRRVDVVDALTIAGENRIVLRRMRLAGHGGAGLAGIPRLPSARRIAICAA